MRNVDRDIDAMIEETLSAEERDLLERYGREPGYVRQAFGLFSGTLGWVMWLSYVAGLVAFAACIYSLWQVFASEEVLVALRWGIAAVLLFQLAVMLKGFMGRQLQANRVLREIKRLELRLLRIENRTGDP
ncbi:MAG: hypothetical protein JJU22_01400 [Gammaproteobacteria bacterium]|nr:hypothetical protein [Gammaproteobacteria bacterium]